MTKRFKKADRSGLMVEYEIVGYRMNSIVYRETCSPLEHSMAVLTYEMQKDSGEIQGLSDE